MRAVNLKSAHLTDPIGIDVMQPLLTWTAEGGTAQTAYQVVAFLAGKEIWSTGKVGGNSMQTVYTGEAKSRDRIEWHVKLWDENDTEGEWSETARFEYGLLQKTDWSAKWINPEIVGFKPEENQPASYLLREFV